VDTLRETVVLTTYAVPADRCQLACPVLGGCGSWVIDIPQDLAVGRVGLVFMFSFVSFFFF
jgi:hypothetical protein